MHRSNISADSPTEYYKRTIAIPILDHLLCELGSRFDNHQQTALQGLSIVPSVIVTLDPDACASRFDAVCDLYESDLPSPETFQSELRGWQIKWQQQKQTYGEKSLPKNLMLTLREVSSMYPNGVHSIRQLPIRQLNHTHFP